MVAGTPGWTTTSAPARSARSEARDSCRDDCGAACRLCGSTQKGSGNHCAPHTRATLQTAGLAPAVSPPRTRPDRLCREGELAQGRGRRVEADELATTGKCDAATVAMSGYSVFPCDPKAAAPAVRVPPLKSSAAWPAGDAVSPGIQMRRTTIAFDSAAGNIAQVVFPSHCP